MNFKIRTVLFGLLLTTLSYGQRPRPTEYVGVYGPIVFDKVVYNLAWTSHPSANYYKQEYLAPGDMIEKFKKLVMLEVLTGDTSLRDVVAAKVQELKQMKASNPMVNYEAFEKDGEIMLDFLVSENTPDGNHLGIVERNVYRYKSIVDKNGEKGVLLFGVSERAYGDDIDKFLLDLKKHKSNLTKPVGAYKIPEITIAK